MCSVQTNPMSVNHEVKSNLAKLLATEDLVVEHRKVTTACFNVHTRVLTLPMWDRASDAIYDLLVAHEVGHALYTPEDWNSRIKIPALFINVTEDARVEKLMKRRYCGLNKTFYQGYSELNQEDFFSVSKKDLTKYNLADRANLHFKIGNFVSIPIDRKEINIINMIADAETFEDALKAAEALYNYCKDVEKEKVKDTTFSKTESKSTSSVSDYPQSSETFGEPEEANPEDVEPKDSESDQNEETSISDTVPDSSDEEPKVETMESFNDAIKDLIRNDGTENVYVELPKLNLDTIIVENSKIYELCRSHMSQQIKNYELLCKESGTIPINILNDVDQEFNEFKQSAQKEVSYLIKEFECRKAADSYARASTSRTGILNTGTLHTYKFNEDIFKKITTFADGKNHGLIFILDWSGSMQLVLKDTLKQLFNLIWFCKKVSIPFEVKCFTGEWNKKPIYPQDHYTKKPNLLKVDRDFSLLNIFTSKSKPRDLESQMKDIYRLAHSFDRYACKYYCHPKLSLSGTPLNESLVALHQIIPNFKKDCGVQKIQCVILTDGDASPLLRHVEVQRNFESAPTMGVDNISSTCVLRNRKTGRSYNLFNSPVMFTNTLLRDLRDSFTDVNFIGIRIIASRDVRHFISNQSKEFFDALMSEWKKEKSFAITESGYHRYFGISSSAISSDVEFKVEEDSTKATIRNAFKKSLNSKKMNKKFLNEFIKLVA